MRELAYAGLVAIVFGLGSFYATDQFGGFNTANLVAGGVAIVTALALGCGTVLSVYLEIDHF